MCGEKVDLPVVAAGSIPLRFVVADELHVELAVAWESRLWAGVFLFDSWAEVTILLKRRCKHAGHSQILGHSNKDVFQIAWYPTFSCHIW